MAALFLCSESGGYGMRDKKVTELVRPETLNDFKNGYERPTAQEVRNVVAFAGLTGSAAGGLLGVDGRTIRKWVGGEAGIPFAAWRLLCIYTGLVDPVIINELTN